MMGILGVDAAVDKCSQYILLKKKNSNLARFCAVLEQKYVFPGFLFHVFVSNHEKETM